MSRPLEQTQQFRDRVDRALLERAEHDDREDVLEAVAEIYRDEASIYGRAYDHVSTEALKEVVDETLEEAREIQSGDRS